jgi:hypothetical protein
VVVAPILFRIDTSPEIEWGRLKEVERLILTSCLIHVGLLFHLFLYTLFFLARGLLRRGSIWGRSGVKLSQSSTLVSGRFDVIQVRVFGRGRGLVLVLER